MTRFDRRLYTPAHTHGVNPYPAPFARPRRGRGRRVLLALALLGAVVFLLSHGKGI